MSQSSREAAEACTTALGDGEGEQAGALRARSLCFVLPPASWPVREAFKNIAQRLSVEEPNLARYGLTLGRGGRGTCGDSGAVHGEPSAILLHGPRPRAGFSHTRGPDGQ